MLVASDLADILKGALGFSSKPTSAQILGISTAIIAHLATSPVNFLPGTITGEAPPSGGTLENGAGSGGIITTIPPTLVSAFVSVFGKSTPQISGFAQAISIHLATGLVEFQAGNVTGACSNTPTSPGVLAGQAMMGTISGLDPTLLSNQIALGISQIKPSPQLKDFSSEFCAYIESDAEVEFLPGTVVATCLAGGGDIEAGAATGGIIT